MAPKGLETVRQKFEADNAAYIDSIKEMIEFNDLFIDSIRLVKEQIKDMGAALGDISNKEIKITVDNDQALAGIAAVKAAMAGLGDKTIHIRAVSDALDDMGDSAAGAAEAIRNIGGGGEAPGSGGFGAQELNNAISGIKDQIDALLGAQDKLTKSQGDGTAAIEKKARAVRGITDDMVKAAKAAQDWAFIDNQVEPAGLFLAVMGTKVEALKKVQDAAEAASEAVAEAVRRGGEANRQFNEANFGPWRPGGPGTNPQPPVPPGAWPSEEVLRRYTPYGPGEGGTFTWPTGSSIPPSGRPGQERFWGPYGPGTSGPWPGIIYGGGEGGTPIPGGGGFPMPPGGYFPPGRPAGPYGDFTGFPATFQARGTGGIIPPLLAMLGGAYPGGPGGGGGLGGGGLGGFFTGGGLGGNFPGGTAIAAFANTAAAIGRVYPLVHWAIMLGNELLATAGPAAVALAGAGLVGFQGGQQVGNRAQALFSVAEALGPSSGQSVATMLRVPNTLQQLQNQYGSGEVYGLAGAGINALRTGGGNAFLQLGQNTLQMISGAAASFVLAMKGGLGQAAGKIVAGGTQYAQQFGDTLLNVGKTLMNTAQFLPGVGSMILTTAQAATGGLADFTRALGPGLLPLLGFEAGTRYGPTIVGGGAAALANLLPFGLGGKVPLAARAATAADVARGAKTATGALAAVGDALPAEAGAGIAGLLGGLTAPEIGLLAVGALAIGKSLTGKTADQQKYSALASGMNLSNIASNMGQIASGAFAGGALPPPQLGTLWSTLARTTPGGGAVSPAFGQAGSILAGGFGQAEQGLYQAGVGFRGSIADLFTGKWSDALHHLGDVWSGLTSPGGFLHGLGQMLGIVGPPPNPAQAAMQQLGTAFTTWSDTLGAPGQVEAAWAAGGGGKIGTQEALNIFNQAGLNPTTAFDSKGNLTAKARQQLQNYQSGYQAMTGTVPGGAAGGTLAAINAVGIMNALSSSTGVLATNQKLDQLTAIISGGGAGTAALTTLLGSAALTGGAITQGPLTQAGAAAFTAFSSTTGPSVIAQAQQNLDWLRTAQVLGAFGGSSVTQAGMGKFALQQAFNVPGVRGSALAMAQLSPLAQQFGMAPFTPGETAKQEAAAFQAFFKGGTGGAPADTAKQYAAQLTSTTQRIGQLPQDYQSFVTTATSGAQTALGNAIDTYGAGVQQAFMTSVGAGTFKPGSKLEQQYAGFLKAAGFSPQGAADTAGYAAKVAGASPKEIKGVIDYVAKYEKGTPPASTGTEKVTPKFDKGQAPLISGTAKYTNEFTKPATQTAAGVVKYVNVLTRPNVPTLSGTIVYHAVISTAANISGAGNLGSLGGHTGSGMQTGMLVPGYGGGDIFPAMLEPGELVVPKHMVPTLKPFLGGKIPGFQSGGLAGVGVPDIIGVGTMFRISMQDTMNNLANALSGVLGQFASSLAPHLGPQIGPFSGRGGGGGGGGGGGSSPQGFPVQIASVTNAAAAVIGMSFGGGPGGGAPMPAAAQKVIDAFEKTFKSMGTPWGQLATQYLQGLLDAVKNPSKETAAQATALTGKVSTAINFGKNLAASTLAGLNLAGMTGLPQPTMTAQGQPYGLYADQATIAGGGTVPVQQQMGDYLQTIKSFQGDLGKLTKEGLSKSLISQLLAAGPVQGDVLAQSILSGPGGVKAANQLYSQISKASTSLGVQGMEAIYTLPKDKSVKVAAHVTGAAAINALQAAINAIHGKTVTVKVNLVESGGASPKGSALTNTGSSGTGNKLNKAQLNQVTRQLQGSLLQQAKRNRRTGIALPPPYSP